MHGAIQGVDPRPSTVLCAGTRGPIWLVEHFNPMIFGEVTAKISRRGEHHMVAGTAIFGVARGHSELCDDTLANF
jgi:hypothetical protein